jgi:microsomal dipeptidase-like Zn-dependent dipeptidase
LVWNQIRHIAEVLDANGQYAWGIQCLGTDFDGIIDPIDGYWTATQIDDLDDYLLMHVYNYVKEVKIPCPLQQERNKKIAPEKIVDRFMTGNALDVLARMM